MEASSSRRWIVAGRVQGVGFRWFVHSRASKLALRGWVANLDDGSVEVIAQGSEADLASLDEIVRRGPPGSQVTRVTTDDVPHEVVDTKSFIIKG